MRTHRFCLAVTALLLLASCGTAHASTPTNSSPAESSSAKTLEDSKAASSSQTPASSSKPTSATSASSSSSTPAATSISSSEETGTPLVTLIYQNFPAMGASAYPDPAEVTVGTSTFHYEYCAQGGGNHSNTIQIKSLKNGTQGLLYNTTAIHASRIVVDELNTSSASYTYQASLTAYAGNSANPTSNETKTTLVDKTDGAQVLYHCVYSFASSFDYFRLIATTNAIYAVTIAFYA